MRSVIFAMAALCLAGCQEEDSGARDTLARQTLHWAKLKDGSSFAVVKDLGTSSSAVRCWPAAKDGFRCLTVSKNDAALGLISGEQFTARDLPEYGFGLPIRSSGYSCSRLMDYREEISRNGASLVSNKPDYRSPRWTRSYVAKYMADNDVVGTHYFKCLDAIEAVTMGSLQTLGTTSVSRAMLD